MKSGSAKNALRRIRHLKPRDINILSFIHRYKLGTANLISRTYCPNDSNNQNALRILRRLVGKGLLVEHNIKRKLVYFQLTRKGQSVLDVEVRTTRPFTEDSLPRALAIATYCVDNQFRRLTAAEFRSHYPSLTRRGLRSSAYCVVSKDGQSFLRMMLFDRGGSVRRIPSKVYRTLRQRDSLPAFRSLIQARRFEIVFLTGHEARLKRLKDAIEKAQFSNVKVVAEWVPDVGEMLTLNGENS